MANWRDYYKADGELMHRMTNIEAIKLYLRLSTPKLYNSTLPRLGAILLMSLEEKIGDSTYMYMTLFCKPVVDINIVDKRGRSCLHLAAIDRETDDSSNEHQDIIPYLLDSGCDVNIVDNDGKLPIETTENKSRIKAFKFHILKLLIAGLFVCKRNIEIYPEVNKGLSFYREILIKELSFLKTTPGPISGYSYYDLLIKSQHKLALRFKKGDIDKVDEEILIKARNYRGMIANSLVRISLRREIFDMVESVLYEIFFPLIPDTCIHQIYFYLNNAQLYKFVPGYGKYAHLEHLEPHEL